jgi:two-component system, sensor histidine kinase
MNEEGIHLHETLDHLRKIERAMYDFMISIYFEILTPTNIILGYSDLLLETELTEEQKELLSHIVVSTKHLQRTWQDIKDSTRSEAGWLELDMEQVDFKQVVEHLRKTLSEYVEISYRELNSFSYRGAKPKIGWYLPDDLPRIKMNSPRIERILLEALLAAVSTNMIEERGVTFSVSCDDEWLHVQIADDRAGLPEHIINLKPDLPRTSEEVLRKHGGTLEIKDREGGGWVVNLRLPCLS